jgi:hypothetical protein
MNYSGEARTAEEPFRIRGDFANGAVFRDIFRGFSSIPLDKKYGELSAEHRAILHNAYQGLGEHDEPPYPADGLQPIIKAMAQAQQKSGFEGSYYVLVDVSPDGSALEAQVFGTNDNAMATFAGSLFMLTKFKPALCNREPCRQKFAFSVRFTTN